MFGLEPFKAFASAPMFVVITAMITQILANAFVKFKIVDPRDLVIVFCILTNDSNSEIVSKKKKIRKLAFDSQLLRTLPCAEFDHI